MKAKWFEMAVREVWAQCQLGKAAYGSMMAGISDRDTDRIFSSIQALLSHTANVSKMLKAEQQPRERARVWSERILRQLSRLIGRTWVFQRRLTIGDLLAVADHSLVHRDGRKFRNDLEHYDERLLRWLLRTGPQVTIMDFNVMPKGAVRLGAGANQVVVRNLNPSTHVFTLADRDLELKPLVDELRRIQGIAEHWVRENV